MKKTDETPKKKNTLSRRKFVGLAASGSAAITILPSHTISGLGHVVPSDKVHLAAIGCGGEGAADIRTFMKTPKNNVVISHLCDVDDRMAAPRIKEFPKAKFYHDWRELFDKESKNFDAVTVAIPDHNHAVVGLAAMQLQKHLYLQKPLTHDIYEARILTQAAAKYKVVTQMGDQEPPARGCRSFGNGSKPGSWATLKR
ncbi:MAG: Gfo/Idh/MocA family oxidoreductase [Bacteroidales bacterium]